MENRGARASEKRERSAARVRMMNRGTRTRKVASRSTFLAQEYVSSERRRRSAGGGVSGERAVHSNEICSTGMLHQCRFAILLQHTARAQDTHASTAH